MKHLITQLKGARQVYLDDCQRACREVMDNYKPIFSLPNVILDDDITNYLSPEICEEVYNNPFIGYDLYEMVLEAYLMENYQIQEEQFELEEEENQDPQTPEKEPVQIPEKPTTPPRPLRNLPIEVLEQPAKKVKRRKKHRW